MMATTNSRGALREPWLLCSLLLCVAAACGARAAEPAGTTPSPAAVASRVHRLYLESQHRWQQKTNSAEAAWRFARACFDWADLALDDAQRAALAEQGIVASRQAIQLQPNSAPAYYYLGLNLGQLAQTKRLSALKLVDQMEEAWKRAIELDETFDYAGPHRSLGLLYRDAPAWSVGSRTKARQHLQKAVELCPVYPGNRLSLLEAQLDWGETRAVQSQLGAMEEQLQSARTKFIGEEWVRDWQDWDKRWRKIKARVVKVPARSPRDSR